MSRNVPLSARFRDALEHRPLVLRKGRLTAFNGLVAESDGPDAALGELCHIVLNQTMPPVLAEIVGFRDGKVLLMPYGSLKGVLSGASVVAQGHGTCIPVAPDMVGRVLDALGRPLDGAPGFNGRQTRALMSGPLNPLDRQPLSERLETGIKAIDGLLPLAKGQRIGIFAGSGVGKSTLLGMLAGQVKADVIVIGLIGERGREVRDFLTDALSEDGKRRSVLIAATADQPALMRANAVHSAHAVAEYFRDQGKDVLLLVDSITRFAMAQREIGMAAGEPPTSRGYPPSVFNLLPQVLERCGSLEGRGSITAIYSVLVEGDDMSEPVADHMRAILDGHIVLARHLVARGQFPAIDVQSSISRLQGRLCSPKQLLVMQRIRSLTAIYEESRDLVDMGAYQSGANALLDEALRVNPAILSFLAQSPGERFSLNETLAAMSTLAGGGA